MKELPQEILKEALYKLHKEFGIAVESLDVHWLYSLDGSGTIIDIKIEGDLK
ncbi:MAG TPA: hypothetical protein GX005_09675 [Bacteroidales bacterium]|nr:hypothetical protein [Bacteroidales bacterium]